MAGTHWPHPSPVPVSDVPEWADAMIGRQRHILDEMTRERDHYRERAETLAARADWLQHVAATAMREGLAECERLRALRDRASTALACLLHGVDCPQRRHTYCAHERDGGPWSCVDGLDAAACEAVPCVCGIDRLYAILRGTAP